MAPRAEFARQQGPMAVAAVPRAVVRLSVTEALCFHLFGPEQAFGGGELRERLPLARSRANSALTFWPRQ